MHWRDNINVSPLLSSWLDLARGLAALEVVASHAYFLLFMDRLPGPEYDAVTRFAYSALWNLTSHGFDAVMIFFVMSGYLVGGPALIRARSGRLDVTEYFTARVTRLYVVLIPALLLSAVLYAVAHAANGWQSFLDSHLDVYPDLGISTSGPRTAICNALFLQTIACHKYAGNLSLWSLSNEFWYYTLFFALLSVRRNLWWALPIAGIIALFVLAERFDDGAPHTGLKFLYFFGIWGLGVVIYALVMPLWLWVCSFAAGFAGLYLLSATGMLAPWAIWYAAIGLVTAALIVGIEHLKIPLPRFFRFSSGLANMSFSLYAIHLPVLLLLTVFLGQQQDFTRQAFMLDISFILVAMAAGSIFYAFFESRTPAVRKWLLRLFQRRRRIGFQLLD